MARIQGTDAPAIGRTLMPQTEHEAAIAEFLLKNAVTRCPTACVAPTRTALADADRAALCDYSAAREAARIEKLRNYPQRITC
jgi:hypothetical protein